jgi:hypothetical protein
MIVLPFRIMPVTENIASTETQDAFAVRYMRASDASDPNLVSRLDWSIGVTVQFNSFEFGSLQIQGKRQGNPECKPH